MWATAITHVDVETRNANLNIPLWHKDFWSELFWEIADTGEALEVEHALRFHKEITFCKNVYLPVPGREG